MKPQDSLALMTAVHYFVLYCSFVLTHRAQTEANVSLGSLMFDLWEGNLKLHVALLSLYLQRVKTVKVIQAGKSDLILPLFSGGLFIPLC